MLASNSRWGTVGRLRDRTDGWQPHCLSGDITPVHQHSNPLERLAVCEIVLALVAPEPEWLPSMGQILVVVPRVFDARDMSQWGGLDGSKHVLDLSLGCEEGGQVGDSDWRGCLQHSQHTRDTRDIRDTRDSRVPHAHCSLRDMSLIHQLGKPLVSCSLKDIVVAGGTSQSQWGPVPHPVLVGVREGHVP